MSASLRLDTAGGLGRAGRSGAIFHLSFRSGSRAGGASAHAAYEYLTREGEYDDADRDPSVYTESGHMPLWAEDDPGKYWAQADLDERANGRLFVAADAALPCDLSLDDKIELAHDFAASLTDEEHLPYTVSIHAGLGPNGEEHNPHVHLMFSERPNDGIERAPEQWFRRADRTNPEDGGPPKSRTFHGPAWVEEARSRWAELVNKKLEQEGRDDRVDHRSYERQGLEREPGEHYGSAAASMLDRTGEHDRLQVAATQTDTAREVAAIDVEIAQIEFARAELLRDAAEADRTQAPADAAPDRDDDWSWGR